MNRRVFLWLLAAFLSVPLLAKEALAAPRQGSVFVRTMYPGGTPAPFQQIGIQKLQGNYPVPPGPYVTNSVGQIWVGLYPGVYRFNVPSAKSTPAYWDVNVSSGGEYYLSFYLNAEEM